MSNQKEKFPITVDSLPCTILSAFKKSGYYQLLTKEQRAQAEHDPKAWLKSYPYLFAWYPDFFRDKTGLVKATPRNLRAAKKQYPMTTVLLETRMSREERVLQIIKVSLMAGFMSWLAWSLITGNMIIVMLRN